MKMSRSDIQSYPKFAAYVRYKMPELVNVGVIVKNVKKFGSLTSTELRHALAWGNDPLVIVTDLSNNQCGVPAAYGCFEHANPSQIEMDPQFVQEFESGNGAGLYVTAFKRRVYLAGVILLHELCHWGNFKHGVAEPVEQGMAFETATYGKVIPS